jgi:hypothetical protein
LLESLNTYGQLLENINKYFIVLVLLVIQLSHGLGDSQRGDGTGLEYFGNEFRGGRGLLSRSHSLCFVHNEWADMFSLNELGVPVVDDLVYDFINEHEVFTDSLFVEHSAVVSEHLHHAVYQVDDSSGLHVVLAGSYEVNAKLLGKEVVHSIHILNQN